jgi:UDP-glucose:(heptosyl)LPS alpha-1,3-glucosyltransferase
MTDRLKIAFVVDRFGHRFGGAEAYGVELMRELAHTHDITVFARDYDPQCPVQLPYVPLRSWRGVPSWVRVLLFALRARRATRQGFDIVHSHMNGWCGDIEVVHVTPVRFNWRVRPLPWLKRASSYISPRVQTYLGLEKRRVAPRPGHRTVAVSALIASQLQQAYGTQRQFPVIAPGVVAAQPDPAFDVHERRQALGFSRDDCICLLVARNPMRKGLPTVIQALLQLPEQYKLLVVGANAAAREFMQRQAGNAALADRVKLVPETPDVAPYYRLANVYVHPTLNDSFGMAPLEAMSYGLPVVLSPAPWCGFAQYVKPGTEALVLDHPENANQLAQYIARIDTSATCRATLIHGAQQVVQRHGWDQVAAQYLALYQAVLAERNSS